MQFGGRASAKKVPPPERSITPQQRNSMTSVQSAALAEPLAPIDRACGIGLAPQPAAVTVVVAVVIVERQFAEDEPCSATIAIATPAIPTADDHIAVDSAPVADNGAVCVRNSDPDIDIAAATSCAVDRALAATVAATSRTVDCPLATTVAATDCPLAATATAATNRALAATAATCFLTTTTAAWILSQCRDRKKSRSKGCSHQSLSYSCHGTLLSFYFHAPEERNRPTCVPSMRLVHVGVL